MGCSSLTAKPLFAEMVTIATLICERDAAMAAISLPRICGLCAEAQSLVIFEDGSLREESAARLLALLPLARIVRRDELDAFANEHLARRPNSLAHHHEHPLALKLVAIPAFLAGDFVFFDVDILLFERFSLAKIRSEQTTSCIFMRDVADGYSARSIDLVFKHRLRTYSRLNSGIIALPSGAYDPDFIEWFLGVPEFRNFPHLLEQTCWAVMPRKIPVRYIDPGQIWCAQNSRRRDDKTVGTHFIFQTKKQLFEAAQQPFGTKAAVELTTVAASVLTPMRMLRNALGRALGGSAA